jgi:hypothetical protein
MSSSIKIQEKKPPWCIFNNELFTTDTNIAQNGHIPWHQYHDLISYSGQTHQSESHTTIIDRNANKKTPIRTNWRQNQQPNPQDQNFYLHQHL